MRGSQVVHTTFARMTRCDDDRRFQRLNCSLDSIDNRRQSVEPQFEEIGYRPDPFCPEQIGPRRDHGDSFAERRAGGGFSGTIYRGSQQSAKIDKPLSFLRQRLIEHPLDILGENVELKVDQIASLGAVEICIGSSVGNDPHHKSFREHFGDCETDAVHGD